MNILFLGLSLFITSFIAFFAFIKFKSKLVYFAAFFLIFPLFLLIFPLKNSIIIFLKIAILILVIIYFLYKLLTTDDFYSFKLAFFYLTIFFIFLFTFFIELVFFNASYQIYVMEIIPIVILIFFYPNILKKERMKLDTFFFNFIISIVFFFPIFFGIIEIFFKNFRLNSLDNIVFFSFMISLIFVTLLSIIKPFFNIISPIYFNFDKKLVIYLSELLNKKTREETLKYSENFIKHLFPLSIFKIIEKDQQINFQYMEKRGRPLFAEEYNFLNIIKKQLNSKIRNIYFLEELEKKLNEIQTLQKEIAEYEVFSIMGQMIATISHQLRNPLAILKNSVELLKNETLSNTERNEIVQSMYEELQRIQLITENFLNFARNRKLKNEKIDLKTLILQIIKKNNNNGDLITVKGNRIITVSKSILTEILEILIDNAIFAIKNKTNGKIIITIDKNSIKIKDNGEKVLEPDKIFEPFYTTKVKGIGLGLTLAKRLANILHMELIFKNGYKWKTFILKWRDNENSFNS